MVPVCLQLRNFLSYGEAVPPLDFTNVQMACLSGANGHGKSAILDAITWALWGRTRRSSRGGDLIRLDASDMWVDLVFDQEGERYRVRRAQRRGRDAAATTLDFFLRDPASDTWRTLSLNSLRATEARVQALLRMDYDTFVNSAFLVQGRADEFTRKTNAERRQVLSDILGLQRYDRLCDLAKAARNEAERAAEQDRNVMDSLRDELREAEDVRARRDETAAAVARLEAALAQVEAEAEQVRAALEAERHHGELLRQARRDADRAAAELAELAAELAELDRALALLQQRVALRPELERQRAVRDEAAGRRADLERLHTRRQEWLAQQRDTEQEIRVKRTQLETELRGLRERVAAGEVQRDRAAETLARRDRLREQELALSQQAERLARCDQAASQHRALSDQVVGVERALAAARSALEADARGLARRIEEQRRVADRLGEATDRLEAARAALGESEGAQVALAAERAAQAERDLRMDRLVHELDRLTAERTELREHRRILASGGGRCPVCHQQLQAQRRGELESDYDTRLAEAEAETAAKRAEGRELRELSTALADRVALLDRQAGLLPRRASEVTRAEEAVSVARTAAAELARLQDEAQQLKARMLNGDYEPDAHTALRRLQERLGELDYDPGEHEQLRRRVAEGRALLRELAQLEQAEQSHAAAVAELDRLGGQVTAVEAELRDDAFARAEQVALAHLQASLSAEPWDQAGWDSTTALLEELADWPQRWQAMVEAETRQPEELARRERGEQRRAALTAARQQAQAETERLEGLLGDEGTLLQRRDATAERTRLLRGELGEQQSLRGQLQARADRHVLQQAELDSLVARTADRDKRLTVLEALVAAFSRNGIPALILESAVPEIEEHANRILAELTEHRMSLVVRLQRATRSGAARETLDIEIRDDLGARSYENYSGGEAFRVDFALRLSLSRLLARRAGARLRTLIIDEGFGTQDEQGLEQLVDAIHAMRHEFDLMLVVTHLAALKDRFENRIEVTKDPELGSRFELVMA